MILYGLIVTRSEATRWLTKKDARSAAKEASEQLLDLASPHVVEIGSRFFVQFVGHDLCGFLREF